MAVSQPETVVATGGLHDAEVAGVPVGPICPLPPACPTGSTEVLSLPPPPPPPGKYSIVNLSVGLCYYFLVF